MSYLVLARKWRPHHFDDMVGQQHVLKALIHALDQQRLHHAYLFTGSRGVGKTTIARILAKCLNCEQGISAKPCGTCSACVAIDAGRFVDLIEVDAASRTKVEDTRELLSNVQYAPTQGRYKVYLIDEVHMLTGHSFNALLKTLEEPPEHVKFLLATTDPQKLPVTVLSRCLQFHLKNMLPDQIVAHCEHVLNAENIPAQTAALWQIAHAADGSMRDALSLLDQAIAFSGGEITEVAMREMLGTIEQSQLNQLLSALATRDGAAIYAQAKQLAEQGIDFQNALSSLLSTLHRVAILQRIPESLDDNLANQEFIQQLASNISPQDVQLFYQIGLHGLKDLPLAPSPRIGFEMTLLRMLAFRPADTAPAPEIASPTVAKQVMTTAPVQTAAPEPVRTPEPSPAAVSNETAPASPPEQTSPAPTPSEPKPSSPTASNRFQYQGQDWGDILPRLALTGVSQALASHCSLHEWTDKQITLHLDPAHSALLTDNAKMRIESSISKSTGVESKLSIEVKSSDQATPAAVASAEAESRQNTAEQAIDSDPNVQAIVERFDAIIAPDSVKAPEA